MKMMNIDMYNTCLVVVIIMPVCPFLIYCISIDFLNIYRIKYLASTPSVSILLSTFPFWYVPI